MFKQTNLLIGHSCGSQISLEISSLLHPCSSNNNNNNNSIVCIIVIAIIFHLQVIVFVLFSSSVITPSSMARTTMADVVIVVVISLLLIVISVLIILSSTSLIKTIIFSSSGTNYNSGYSSFSSTLTLFPYSLASMVLEISISLVVEVATLLSGIFTSLLRKGLINQWRRSAYVAS